MAKEYRHISVNMPLIQGAHPLPGTVISCLRLEGFYRHVGIVSDECDKNGANLVISVDKEMHIVSQESITDPKWYNYTIDETPDNAEEVCRRAKKRVGEFWHYNFATNNCEHFVSEVVSGEKRSGQVEFFFLTALAGFVLGKNQTLRGALAFGATAGLVRNRIKSSTAQRR